MSIFDNKYINGGYRASPAKVRWLKLKNKELANCAQVFGFFLLGIMAVIIILVLIFGHPPS